jgi:hypothetical protein
VWRSVSRPTAKLEDQLSNVTIITFEPSGMRGQTGDTHAVKVKAVLVSENSNYSTKRDECLLTTLTSKLRHCTVCIIPQHTDCSTPSRNHDRSHFLAARVHTVEAHLSPKSVQRQIRRIYLSPEEGGSMVFRNLCFTLAHRTV